MSRECSRISSAMSKIYFYTESNFIFVSVNTRSAIPTLTRSCYDSGGRLAEPRSPRTPAPEPAPEVSMIAAAEDFQNLVATVFTLRSLRHSDHADLNFCISTIGHVRHVAWR